MAAAPYASRYARALADIVAANRLDAGAVDAQLGDFLHAWNESRDLREVFLDPSFPAERKVAILDKLNTRLGMQGTVRNFIAVLSNHHRMEGFPEVVAEFRREMNARLGISEVDVTTARALGAEERAALERRIAEMTGMQVRARFHEDRALVGGAELRVGSMVYDGSVRGRLEQVREKLATS